jgi:hypothetical protein
MTCPCREALGKYADPRHWGIERDEFRQKRMTWIGPGAMRPGMPDGMMLAREALAKPWEYEELECER